VSDAAVPFEDIAAAPDVRDAELTEPGPLEALPGALREPVAGPRILGMDPVVVERKRVAAEAWQRMVDAQASGARLEGIVKRAIPGGLAVEIDGVAGFVPASQIRVPIGVDAASLVGSQQPLVVLDVDEKRRRAVVSQRRAVDARQREERAELLAQVRVGVVRSVKVVRLAPFGVFVEIGPGLDGLVPIGELALERVERIEDAAKVGDIFDAEIIRVEDRGKKIALSRKAALRDPWRDALDVVRVGGTVTGHVVGKEPRLQVELAAGVVGMVREADADPAEYVLGEAIQVVVRSADRRTRKINLSLPHAIAVRPSSTGFASLGEELARPKR